ncbi:hypothetical protein BD779DRAFT_1520137 [Infundibulicybe gibba]|nr:hypothetical protein BD779DRAFT_1520137 [Infundibulicybe gibba]
MSRAGYERLPMSWNNSNFTTNRCSLKPRLSYNTQIRTAQCTPAAYSRAVASVYGPKRTEVEAGMPMRLGMDCYDFAGRYGMAGTVLDNSPLLQSTDKKAWIDGDLIRLLLLWNYGGVWVDMDTLLTRNLEPSSSMNSSHNGIAMVNKIYKPLNGALMAFHKHSPYLCEAFHLMHTSAPPRPGDGRSCRLDNRLPDPFVADRSDDRVLGKVFAVHLHNQWEKAFPSGGWVDRLLLGKYERQLAPRGGNRTGETDGS